MEIAMKIGEDKYIGMNAEMAYTVASLDKALIFEHAYDICEYINKNRKKINAFLRKNKVHMIIKVVKDTETDPCVLSDKNMVSDDDFSMAC